jgi:glycosyltransferase involved in cell wall biosynthesis
LRILLVTDAWYPQINGVVRTLDTVCKTLRADGHAVETVTPDDFRTVPCPTYPEIRLALNPGPTIARRIDEFAPDAIHIATEGPLGFAARRLCLRRDLRFTTSFHTKFPEYIHARFRVPVSWGYRFMRWFHAPAVRVMVATDTIMAELQGWGFTNTVKWSRGVDTGLFRPRGEETIPEGMRGLARPIFLNVGRVAVEKNIEAFLALDLPGTKVVVGDGPQHAELARRFPDAVFAGARHGEDLARHFAAADAFVFPSLTDTFGLVLLEALASGTPVAAFPVPGPLDVIVDAAVGCLDEDLEKAAHNALSLDRDACRAYALNHSWQACAHLFRDLLSPFGAAAASPAATPVQPAGDNADAALLHDGRRVSRPPGPPSTYCR